MNDVRIAVICVTIAFLFCCVPATTADSDEELKGFGKYATGRNTKSDPNGAICDNSSSLDDFPVDLFTEEQRLQGAIILHIFAAIYLFTLLSVVCNDYFLPSVEYICEDLSMPKDVAAATFMAIATTTPEFFTNVIGTFITESDIGLGAIIGSLMFNTLGVAAVASFAAPKPVQLDWWPITRDSLLYASDIVLLIAFAWDSRITLNETIVMAVLLFFHFLFIFQSKRIMPKIKWFFEDYLNCCRVNSYDLPSSFVGENFQTDPVAQQANSKVEKVATTKDIQSNATKSSIDNNPIYMIYANSNGLADVKKDVETVEEMGDSLWRLPNRSGLGRLWWAFTWPIKFVLTITIPNPKTFPRMYPFTFLMCIIWIGANAYLIVWMVTIIGFTFKIPDAVMGLTFLAAGGCLPEGISSVLTIRKGEGGIGVSNSLGANCLAILMSLGIPWLIKNFMNRNDPDKAFIALNPYSTEYNILLLFLAVIALYVVLTVSRYRLMRSVGYALAIIYGFIITFAILLEMNVFFPNVCA